MMPSHSPSLETPNPQPQLPTPLTPTHTINPMSPQAIRVNVRCIDTSRIRKDVVVKTNRPFFNLYVTDIIVDINGIVIASKGDWYDIILNNDPDATRLIDFCRSVL
jgi:hypothetical protein